MDWATCRGEDTEGTASCKGTMQCRGAWKEEAIPKEDQFVKERRHLVVLFLPEDSLQGAEGRGLSYSKAVPFLPPNLVSFWSGSEPVHSSSNCGKGSFLTLWVQSPLPSTEVFCSARVLCLVSQTAFLPHLKKGIAFKFLSFHFLLYIGCRGW